MTSRPEDERLAGQFRQMNVEVDQALPAWTGLKPFFGGYGNWNFLFTQWRVLVWRGERVELWTRWSGLPSRCLLAVPAVQVSVTREGRKYDRVAVGPRQVWVPSKYRRQVDRSTP